MKKKILFTSLILTLLFFLTGVFIFYKNQFAAKTEIFSVIVLPDTQKYTMHFPETFSLQTKWIADNKQTLNIKFVSHLGDIVQSGAREPSEWQAAQTAFSYLDVSEIPYGVAPGNHDIDVVDDETSQFTFYNSYFPLEKYKDKSWYRGNFRNYQNNFQEINIADESILFLNIEVDPDDEVLVWANSVVKNYPKSKVILTTHAYLDDASGMWSSEPHFRTAGNSGKDIWDKLVSPNCSIFMILSGHFHSHDGENLLVSDNECRKPVHQIVQDYQSREEGGNGLLRIYSFDLDKKQVNVSTYSPQTNTYETDQDSDFSFDISQYF